MPQNKTEAPTTLVRVALVRREFGVRGEIAVSPLGGNVDRFVPGLYLRFEGEDGGLKVRSARSGPHDDVILAVDGFSNPEDAALLRGKYLCVSQSERRQLNDDEWFVDDLVGLRAVDLNGAEVGTVLSVDESPAHPLLVVDGQGGEQLIPLVPAFVDSVDLADGLIRITPWKWDDES